MKRLIPFVMLLSGCAHTGNFAKAPPGQDGLMAHDAARAMRAVWSPDQTTLKADVTTRDPFLAVLLGDLRTSGYAIAPPTSKTGSELRYVVDRVDDAYRVSIAIDGHSLNRLYRAAQGQLAPASAWSRQD